LFLQRYRYQWMDTPQQVLRKRWDNMEHFPDLPNFSHQVRVTEGSHACQGSWYLIRVRLCSTYPISWGNAWRMVFFQGRFA
jgi:hypothetical protein